jgi:hypothetical protein
MAGGFQTFQPSRESCPKKLSGGRNLFQLSRVIDIEIEVLERGI